MYARIVPEVIDKYRLDVARIGAVQKGYRNESYPLTLQGGEVVNLLFYKRERGIANRITTADTVADRAARDGLPVRTRYDQRLLKVGDSYAAVYHYLPGQTVPWEAFTKRHIKLLGWAMANMHQSLQSVERGDGLLLVDELDVLIERMTRYFLSDDVQQAMAHKLGVALHPAYPKIFSSLVERSRSLDGQQYLHMDMVRGNVLFDTPGTDVHWQLDGVKLSGVIDFEKAAWGLPVCDMARTLAFLLVDCPKPASKVYKYFIDSGYRKRGVNTIAHVNLLPLFIRLFLLHDFYKFLRHTPYESLVDNYHYTRTRDLSKDYGMIHTKS